MSRGAVLNGRIRRQMVDLEKEYQYAVEQAQQAKSTDIEAFWIAAGFGLQGFYTGLEKIFELIARDIDGGLLRDGERWHRDLLDQMNSEIPGVRPQVIDDRLHEYLRTYLGFRHVARSNYTHRLDPALIAANLDLLPDCFECLRNCLLTFCQFLESLDMN